jgi:hypothetical protein
MTQRQLGLGGSESVVRFWHLTDIEAAEANVRLRAFSDISAKVLNSAEDAQLKT